MNALLDSTPILADPHALRSRAPEAGYFFFRGVVSPDRIARLRRFVVETVADLGFVSPGPMNRTEVRVRPGAALAGTGYDDPRWLTLQQRVLPDPRFTDVGDDPAILGVLDALFGEPPLTRRGDICRVVLPGAPHLTTPPHQDHYYTGGTRNLWTAWFPLVETPLELGPLAVLPGSHRAGLLPHGGEGAGRQGVVLGEGAALAVSPVLPGDAILFNCLTVHCALPNRTADRVRLSVDFRYQPSSEPVHVVRIDGSSARG